MLVYDRKRKISAADRETVTYTAERFDRGLARFDRLARIFQIDDAGV